MKPNPIPPLTEMYAWLDRQILAARERADYGHVDYLLERRLKLPEVRAFLEQMGARGA